MNSLVEHGIYGNHSVWQHLLNDLNNNRLAHAYLFFGIKGCGKALTARYFIKHILQADNILAKRIDDNNFLDLLYISKEDKNEITIDTIRKTHDFFNQTAAEGKQKFVIIDEAEDLNANAANALLKILEEPKLNTHIFLISHARNKIIPTIRSRCRIIKFSPLTKSEMSHICEIEKYKELEDFIAGSPGMLKLCEAADALNMYKKLLNQIEQNDIIAFNKFADAIVKNSIQWKLTQDLTLYIATRLKEIDAYDQIINLFRENEIYNLEKKQILLQALSLLKQKL